MGVELRSGDYTRFVRFGKRTVKAGEAAAIWNKNGEHRRIIGPKRVILVNASIRFLTRHTAGRNQYLRVYFRDGTVEHIPGPKSLYLDPSCHDKITVKEGIQLRENEVMFVSAVVSSEKKRSKKGDSSSERNMKGLSVVDGPTLFIPSAEDLVEELEWNILPDKIFRGTDIPKQKIKILTLHTFMTWKVQVPIGSSNGTAMAYATLLVKYRIETIDKVARHKDPHAVLISALLADVHELGQVITENDVKNSADGQLSSILSIKKSYRNIVQAGDSCGFRVGSVKVLDIQPGEKIAKDLDRERELQSDTLTKIAQKKDEIHLQELELEEQEARLRSELDLEIKEARMRSELAAEQHILKLRSIKREIELAKLKLDAQLEANMRTYQSVLEFLHNLKGMGIDLTQVLSAAGGGGGSFASEILRCTPALQNQQEDSEA